MNVQKKSEAPADNRCRVCLCVKRSAHQLNEHIKIGEETRSFLDLLSLCCDIKISSNDGKPQNICRVCKEKAKTCYEFRKCCEKSNSILHSEMDKRNKSFIEHVKVETLSLDKLHKEINISDIEDDDYLPHEESQEDGASDSLSDIECKLEPKDELLKATKPTNLPRAQHMKSFDNKGKLYICECGLIYPKRSSFYNHRRKCNPITVKRLLEKLNPTNLNQPKNLHHPCNTCGRVYRDVTSLLKHMEKNHSNDSKCSYCYLKFKDFNELKFHMKEEHPEKTKEFWECEVCGTVYNSTKCLNAHRRKVHNILDSCEKCGFKAETTLALTEHRNECQKSETNEEKLSRPVNRHHPCSSCDRIFHRVEILLKHIQDRHLNVQKCSYCDLHVNGYDEFKKHIRSKHSDLITEYFACDLCDTIFSSQGGLNGHRRRVHKVQDKCEHCDFEAKHQSDLKSHMKYEHSEIMALTKCHCGFIGTSVDALKAHVLNKNEGCDKDMRKKTIKKCDFCEFTSNSAIIVGRHAELEHTDKKKFSCAECNKKFFFLRKLRAHIGTMHSGKTKKYICELCGARCMAAYDLRTHMYTHTGERPFKCEYCEKAFAQSATLNVHVRSVHEKAKNYVCSVCGDAFNIRNQLHRHQQRRHNTNRKYKCPCCDKTFAYKGELTTHSATHTGVRKFKCDVCGSCFSRITQFKLHQEKHVENNYHQTHLLHGNI